MPPVRISHPPGLDPHALSRGVHAALVSTFGVPEGDFFQIVTEHVAGGIVGRRAISASAAPTG